MNHCKTELGILIDRWTKLYMHGAYNKSFDYAVFKDLFIRTFDMVQHLAEQDSIDKKYIVLLMLLNDFSNTRLLNISEEHKAACHLTHSMAQDCFSRVFAHGEIPVMIDSKNNEYSYKNVDLLIELIKSHA